MNMIIYKLKDGVKFISAFLVALFYKQLRSKDIWIITERREECKDNGYYLFKYIRENHPNISVYYAIDKNSPQRSRIEKYGNILDNNSWKHYMYAISAKKLIGAFLPCGIPDSICFYKFEKLIKGEKIFLQHGISKELIPSLFYENTKADLFICGGKPEFEFVKAFFHYPEENVIYTGFSRFDGLYDFQKDKFVLVMPTWRKWIPSITWHKDRIGNPDEYEYFRIYKKMINDKQMISCLKRHNMKMIFFLHHEMQKYMEYFGDSNEVITFATEKEFDVQKLLKDCSCLITDYSSVSFDVAYMNKPVIYFQFDEDEYYSKHYQKGYFDYDEMGFGKKCKTFFEVQKVLEEILDEDCKMEDLYKQRVKKFFVYHDQENCRRIYEAIFKL